MKLESLPNELLLDIFDYLSIGQILHSFQFLNSHFNQLIFTYRQMTRHLDFRFMSLSDSNIFFQSQLSKMVNQIISITISNDNETPLQWEFFRCNNFRLHRFINLQSLSLYHIHSQKITREIAFELDYLPHLMHIKLINCCLPSSDNVNQSLINKIWNMSKLIYFNINPSSCKRRNQQLCPSVISSSIKYLSIENLSYNDDVLSNMLQYTPYLRCLHIYSYFGSGYTTMPLLPWLVKLEFNERCSSISSKTNQTDKLQMFLQNVPNLCYLTIESLSMFMDGYQWENLITNYLPKLKVFRCKMANYINTLENLKESMYNLLCSFHSHFWLENNHWFIRCHLKSENQGRYYILYHTLPYFFTSLIAITDYSWSASTCPYENDYCWSDSMYDSFLKIKSSIEILNSKELNTNEIISPQRSISFCQRIMNMFQLNFNGTDDLSSSSNIAHETLNLTNSAKFYLELPSNKHFSKFIPSLDQLTSLDVLLTVEYTNRSDLRALLNQACNLYSLSVRYVSKKALTYFLANIKSLSIDKLNLPRVISLTGSLFCSLEQCIILSHSPLGKQCEVLTIEVQHKECIIYLINKMNNLRLLRVISYDECYLYGLQSPTKSHDLFLWLKSTLPSTIKIAMSDCCEIYIQLWIR